MSMTQEWVDEYMQKLRTWRRGDPKPVLDREADQAPDPGPESELSNKIRKWADDHGYPCQCFRQSPKARGFLVPGWPDVTLILQGRVLFLELKAEHGRLSTEQQMLKLQFLHLKAEWYEVRSFKRFLEVVTHEN